MSVLQIGIRCHRSDLSYGYSQLTWARNTAEVERAAASMGLDTVPYAIMFGYGEVWVCHDRDVEHPQVAYELVGYAEVKQ